MANRVTGVRSALLALTGILCLSGLALSQGIDWDNGAQFNAESSGFIGPQLLPEDLEGAPERPGTGIQPGIVHNILWSENFMSFDGEADVSGLDFSRSALHVAAAPATAGTDLTPEQEQHIRMFYSEYLISRVGIDNASILARLTCLQTRKQILTAADSQPGIEAEIEQDEDVLATASIALEQTISNIDETDDTLVAPVPAPFALRPVLPVRPASVAVIQPARAVSVDHLVHVDVPGSWPRRLDQVNNGNFVSIVQNGQNSGGNIFLRDWQNNPQGAAQPRQFNNAPVNNTSESFPASVMFAGRTN